MKTTKCFLVLVFILCASFANAQTDDSKKSEFKQVLKSSLYESIVEISDEGKVLRKDNNGNYFKYALEDIAEVKTEHDGFYNLLITFKDGKTAFTVINGQEGQHKLNVFAFANSDDAEKAKRLLIQIISKE